MRLIIQRVSSAEVKIEGKIQASIQEGLLVFIGVENDDSNEDVLWLTTKLCKMRIFSDEEGKMNLDIQQIDGEILVVSQFTLHASTKKGNRPSFLQAASPEKAILLYENFIHELNKTLKKPVKSGIFGANMQISLTNNGPVTIFIDSKSKE